ncbi:HAMP domain-containing protein [Kutzneria albida]|uniref:HAMP domain-containing protein n=1 Tax=Kutzneria albida DSM 43870 TaxID=1449976 RepID=W5WJY8_9PSEU|nr:cache and HAMP domain-containing protein [Kutzneria albida]AHI01061.1 hypothetical protein KALB_7703 [Kutzneria albida DSM 43870]
MRAPWIAGVLVFGLLSVATGLLMGQSRDSSPVSRVVLDARTESTAVAAQAVARSLNGGLGSLAEIATIAGESLQQRGKVSLKAFEHRAWRSLYVVERATRVVLAEVGDPAEPAVLGDPMPAEPGIRRAQSASTHDILQYVPLDKERLLVGHLDSARLAEQLAVASGEGAWLVDSAGGVIATTNTGSAPPQLVDGFSGGRVQEIGGRLRVASWASLPGKAPASSLNWTVVSTKAVTATPALPGDPRSLALLLAAVLGVLTLLVFAWLHWARARGEAGYLTAVLNHVRDGAEVFGKPFPHNRIAWTTGVAAFLAYAAVVAVIATSLPREEIPGSVASEQQSRTTLAARQVQRALDSGLSDLSAVSSGIKALHDPGTAERLLKQLVTTRPRYAGVVYLSPLGEVRAKAGDQVDYAAIPVTDKPSVQVAPAQGVRPKVLVVLPSPEGRLIAELKPEVLIRPLSSAGPGNTWLVDGERRVIGATGGFTAFEALPRADLEQAAKLAHQAGAGSVAGAVDSERHVLSWAPLQAKELGLSVLTDRAESSLALPSNAQRGELLLLAALVAALTVVIFGWLLAVVVSPLSELVRCARRLARGETGEVILVRRQDDVGELARDLERARRVLITRSS